MPSSVDLMLALAVGQLPLTLSLWGISRRQPRVVTPADRVTLVRAGFACACAVATTLAVLDTIPARSWVLVGLAVPTLLLDGVDGWVARRTNTASVAGAKFDMELDAGVLVILSIAVALTLGPWVLLIGGFRYGYAAACSVWPTLATPLPRSQFRRVVAGIQGAVLTVALAPVVPLGLATSLVAVALALLVASFASQAVAATRLDPSQKH